MKHHAVSLVIGTAEIPFQVLALEELNVVLERIREVEAGVGGYVFLTTIAGGAQVVPRSALAKLVCIFELEVETSDARIARPGNADRHAFPH